MKKLLLVSLFLPIISAAQTFELTPIGFVNSQDQTKNYAVLEFNDISQSDLYNKVKLFVNRKYNSPKTISSEIPNEQLVVDAVDSKEIRVTYRLTGSNVWNFSYKYEFNFKDGKIKFTPTFKSLTNDDDGSEILLTGASFMGNANGMFNKKGEVSKEKGKTEVEESVNDYIKEIKQGITNKEDNW